MNPIWILCIYHSGITINCNQWVWNKILTYNSLLEELDVNLTALEGEFECVVNFSSGFVDLISQTVHIPSKREYHVSFTYFFWVNEIPWEATANLRPSEDQAVEKPASEAEFKVCILLNEPEGLQSKRWTSGVSPTAIRIRELGEIEAITN